MLCKCGCGQQTRNNNKWILGHNSRFKEVSLLARQNASKALMGHGSWHTEQSRKKISSKLTGIKRSEETKKKMSMAKKGQKHSQESKKKMSDSKKGLIPWNKGKKYEECFSNEKVIELKEICRKMGIQTCIKGNNSDTKIERIVENYFLFNDIIYVKQFKYKLGVADFWLPEHNLIIECDGEYWHSKPKIVNRDKQQTIFLEKEGYEVLHLKEKTIYNNVEDMLNKKILRW